MHGKIWKHRRHTMGQLRVCKFCFKPLSGKQRGFCCDKCRHEWWSAVRKKGAEMLHVELSADGRALANLGMRSASGHAEKNMPGWTGMALDLLNEYPAPDEFMCEDFRDWSARKGLPNPPSKRSFGTVFVLASKRNIITRVRYDQVTNKTAHMATASVWRKIA